MEKHLETADTGTFENVIFYKWKGHGYIRTKGNTGRQGAAAKRQSAILGMASRLSASLRKAIGPLSGGAGDRKLMYRFNNAWQQWLRSHLVTGSSFTGDIPQLKGFSFKGEPLCTYFTGPVSLQHNGTGMSLGIPALYLVHQQSFEQVSVKVMLVSCRLDDNIGTKVYETDANMQAGKSQKIRMAVEIREDFLNVVVMSMNGKAVEIVGAWAGDSFRIPWRVSARACVQGAGPA